VVRAGCAVVKGDSPTHMEVGYRPTAIDGNVGQEDIKERARAATSNNFKQRLKQLVFLGGSRKGS